MMTQEEMNRLVPEKLKEIEKEYGVTVLWAVESGSRAWGFASPDSDFDVRFIYKRRPEDYLKLNPDRDVIETPVDDVWDVSGWDLDKTLKLLQKSNPTLYEWMQSPICYWRTDFAERVAPLMRECFSEERMLYHYRSTAVRDIKENLGGEQVKSKKYLYALRPVLACRWVQQFHSAPPMRFSELYETMLPEELKPSVDRLLDLKMHGPEKMLIPKVRDIHDFLDDECAQIGEYLKTVKTDTDGHWNSLNRFFLEEIRRE